jgi:hypothetical protein
MGRPSGTMMTFMRSAALLSIALAGCGGVSQTSADAGAAADQGHGADMAATADMVVASDLAAATDLASVDDLGDQVPDLTVDLAELVDLRQPRDLRRIDLAAPDDLTIEPDLAEEPLDLAAPDLAPAVDLLPVEDLTPAPDLLVQSDLRLDCPTGFADCNGLSADGCEMHIAADPDHCGSCVMGCSIPGAVATCTAGVCGFSVCAAGYGDCNGNPADGCETSTATDPNNCGACGAKCVGWNMDVVGCTAGGCSGTCSAGFADCNGDLIDDGCEVQTDFDSRNCGACGVKCGAGLTCYYGACR